MIDGPTNAKPQRAGWGFAQSTCPLVAFFLYLIRRTGANVCYPFLPIAINGEGYGTALFWGELQ